MANRFTQKAQQVLQYALQSASEMGHTYIGSEHLLLGLLRDRTSVSAHYLTERGTDPDAVRAAILNLAGEGVPVVDVGLPLKNMHTYNEILSEKDVASLCRLVRAFVTSTELAEGFAKEAIV